MGEATPRIRVLHVDDEPDLPDTVTAFLEREDERIDVVTAAGAAEGLSRLAEYDIDCIVSDYDMSGQNGIEFLEAVREDYPELPFILYTGKGSEEVAADAISAGVTDYLQKESGSDQYAVLVNRIANAVESYRSRQVLAERNRALRRYKRLVNSMREAACVYDADGRFEIVNDFLAEWYGTTREALEGQQSRLIPHLRARTDSDPYQALLDGERDQLDGELEVEFPYRGEVIVEYRLTPLRIDGEVEGAVAVARDITERKERQEELERRNAVLEDLTTQLEQQYQTLFEKAPVMGVITRARNGQPIIEDCNTQFVETLGYERDAVAGRNLGEFYAPESRKALLDGGAYARALDGEFAKTRRELLDAEGDIVETLLRAVPRENTDGEVVGTVAMFVDITEREQVKRANERLEEFTRIVSHDLRNPLSVAQGRLDLARADCESEHLAAVAQAHDRMDTLIDDLLTLARQGKQVDALESVDLGEMAAACWETVDTGEGTIRIDTDQTLRADPSRLRQLLENLIGNAIEHGGDDVTVTVGALANGFYVEDDGRGIDPAVREDVFEPGYSASAEGTGFGLSIVKQIVNAHGWEVHLTEGTDGGVRFEITDLTDEGG